MFFVAVDILNDSSWVGKDSCTYLPLEDESIALYLSPISASASSSSLSFNESDRLLMIFATLTRSDNVDVDDDVFFDVVAVDLEQRSCREAPSLC